MLKIVVACRIEQVGAYCRSNKEEKRMVAPYGDRLRQIVAHGKWLLVQVGLYYESYNES